MQRQPDKPIDGVDESRQIRWVAGFSFVLNLLLTGMKVLLASFSGSLAITASAIDSATDTAASLAIFFGVSLSAKKTRSFPLGLYKLENVASVVIAIFIFIAGYEIVREIIAPAKPSVHISVSYILLLIAGTVAAVLFGNYAALVGRKTESPTLIAESRHRQVDALASTVVLISVTCSYLNLSLPLGSLSIDQIGAALTLIFIARTGWELLSDGMRVLLDASIDFDTLYLIRNIIKSELLVDEVTSLTGRNAGRFRFIEATITIKTENLEKAQRISETIEKKIRYRIPHIEKVIVHYGPQTKTHSRLALPLEDGKGRISAHFGEAPYFGLVRVRLKDLAVVNRRIVKNPHQFVETAKGIRVAEWLIGQGVDQVGMKEDISQRGPGYVLANGGVQTRILTAATIDQAIDEMTSSFEGQ